MASSQLKDDKGVLPEHVDPSYSPTRDSHDIVNVQGGDLLDLESVDPVLNAKMKMVNDAIDEIGFTRYQAKLFVLNGFGYVIYVYLFCGGLDNVMECLAQEVSVTCCSGQSCSTPAALSSRTQPADMQSLAFMPNHTAH